MAQILGTDKFIVDRGGSTYKTTFQDIEESLDIDVSHDYTAVVDETKGGEITKFDITVPGTGFLVGQNYESDNGGLFLTFTATKVGDNGQLEDITIISNTPIETVPEDFVVDPIVNFGSLRGITVDVNSAPPIPVDGSVRYKVKQVLTVPDPDDPDNNTIDLINTTGEIEAINVGGTIEYHVTKRGEGYENGSGSIIVTITDPSTGNETVSDVSPITISTIDPGANDPDFAEATITVEEVSDGVDTDKLDLTVTVGGVDKTVTLVPGRGIRFNQLAENEVEVANTITELGGGGGSVSDGATVIVDDSVPTVNVYSIRDGTLWYNLLDGRLYIAVSYVANGISSFDWIDASPSSLNDSLRKNQDDKTDYKIDVNNSLYATHFALERLPLIS